jgi:hypothetical protein
MKAKKSIPVLLLLTLAAGAWALNGKAVTVVSNFLAPVDGAQAADVSRMIVVTTQTTGNVTSIAKTDTILRGRMFYPMWSFDGARIAFYKEGSGLCMVDANGQNLKVLAKMVDWGREDGFYNLSWPGADNGKWIYYVKTCNVGCFRNSSGEVWKVNVDDTTQKSMVCDYTKSNDLISPGIPWFGRFQLSADAKYAAIHAGGGPSDAVWGYANGCIPHEFPPKFKPGTTQIDPGLSEPACTLGYSCDYRGACNTGLSASGSFFYHFSGGHDAIYVNYWYTKSKKISGRYDIGTGAWGSLNMHKDIEPWLSTGPGLGGCLVWPKGSSNSDRVVCVLSGWAYGDMYSPTGSNFVVADWKDKKAAMITNNPKPTIPVPGGSRYWVAEPGDFWVSGGPANCYQDSAGRWIDVNTGLPTHISNQPSISRSSANAAIQGPVAIYSLRGSRVGTYNSQHAMQRHCPGIRKGTYIAVGHHSPARLMITAK